MKNMPTSRISDGTTAKANISRQFSEEASAALTRKAARMPTTIISWLSELTAPRMFVGATSDR